MQYYCRAAADRFGNIQNNRSTSSRAATVSSLGDALDCIAICWSRRLPESTTSRSAHQHRRRNRRRRQAPAGYLCLRDLAERGFPLSSAYALLKQGGLGTPHRWRGLLVVEAAPVNEFLAVRPIPAVGGER